MCLFYKIHPTYIDAIPNFFLTMLSNLTKVLHFVRLDCFAVIFFLSFFLFFYFFIFLFLLLKFLNNLDFYFVNLSVQMVSFSVK